VSSSVGGVVQHVVASVRVVEFGANAAMKFCRQRRKFVVRKTKEKQMKLDETSTAKRRCMHPLAAITR